MNVQVFFGAPIADIGENRFLAALREWLESQSEPSIIFANFIATGRYQRQVDFLIRTTCRLVLVELKCWDPRYAVTGGPNGNWTRSLPTGNEIIEGNPIDQVRSATFALSDMVRSFVAEGLVLDVGQFYRVVDSVVCFYPRIPVGSNITEGEYQSVIGFSELTSLLVTPGRAPSWDDDHWEAFARRLAVYSESDDAEFARDARKAQARISLYSARVADWFAHELAGYAQAGSYPTVETLKGFLVSGQSISLVGPSGAGKSHLARHTAQALSGDGRVVVWLRAREYEAGRIQTLVSRGLATHGEIHASEFFRYAQLAGARVVLVADGVNECPRGLQEELLEQLCGLALHSQASLLVTSQETVHLSEAINHTAFAYRDLTEDERSGVLAEHQGAGRTSISDAVSTPYELSLAAACSNEAGPGATRADVFDAYVRRNSASELVRAGLRLLATEMDREYRVSLTHRAAATLLERAAGMRTMSALTDDVFGSPLLDVSQGAVAFRHELLGRFLVAEELVRGATSARELALRLSEPHHRDLHALGISIESDRHRRVEVLTALANSNLYEAALDGEFGAETQADVVAQIKGTIAAAIHLTSSGSMVVEGEAGPIADITPNFWMSGDEISQLAAAGALLASGHFVDEIGRLLDATDDLIYRAEMVRTSAGLDSILAGIIPAVFVFSHGGGVQGRPLPASWLYNAARFSRFRRSTAAGVAAALFHDASDRSVGRLLFALEFVDPRTPDDAAIFVDLVEGALRSGIYHLVLSGLETSSRGWELGDEVRAALVDVLSRFKFKHIFLSSALVEALGSLGAIEPISGLEDIVAEIERITTTPGDKEARENAAGIFASQFELESVLGPYSEAIDSLPLVTKLTFLAMAVHVPNRMFTSVAISELTNAIPNLPASLRRLVSDAFGVHARAVDVDGFMPTEEIQTHVLACLGYVKLNGQLPIVDEAVEEWFRAWQLVDELLASTETASAETGVVWRLLSSDLKASAADVFFWFYKSTMDSRLRDIYNSVVATQRGEFVELLSWSLTHSDQLNSKMRFTDRSDRNRYFVVELGRLGGESVVPGLEAFLSDSELAETVTEAIRTIRAR